MTVATETAKTAFRLEYILAIEGVGWLIDETDFSQGFEGDVFVSADLDGDLATRLVSATIHHGLKVPEGIGDNLKPVTGKYELSGVSLTIEDTDDWWSTNYVPHSTPNTTTISTALSYEDVNVVLADGTNFATGDVVWVGGREAIKLGTKSGGGAPHTYTTSTRSYVGTPQGSKFYQPYTSAGSYVWSVGATVGSVHKFWHNRAMALYLHVPGEAATNLYVVWAGKLRNIRNADMGSTWTISGTGDIWPDMRRVRIGAPWYSRFVSTYKSKPVSYANASGNYDVGGPQIAESRFASLSASPEELFDPTLDYRLAYFYHYRWASGGNAGVKTSWDAGSVQSVTVDSHAQVIGAVVQIGGTIYWCPGGYKAQGATHGGGFAYISLIPFAPTYTPDTSALYDNGGTIYNEEARFLLDNFSDDYRVNRYSVDKKIRRNPVDVFLCHLLSQDSEYYIGDAIATSTTTAVKFTTPGWTTNEWAGFALFAVEDNNQYECRQIVSNTSDTITVSPAFSNSPTTGGGGEYQIRNTIYDVLPRGWGMGMDHRHVNLTSFESLRDNYLPNAEVGKFYWGIEDEINIFEQLKVNILQAYGIVVYTSGTTHKLTARMVNQPLTDGVDQTYITIPEEDVLREPTLDLQFGKPLGRFNVKVRSNETRALIETHATTTKDIVNELLSGNVFNIQSVAISRATAADFPGGFGATASSVVLQSTLVESAVDESGLSDVAIEALFNTPGADNVALIARLYGMMGLYETPPVVVTLRLAAEYITQINIGELVFLNIATWPTNTFATTRGWANIVARVIGRKVLGDVSGLEIRAELLAQLKTGKYAPAASTTAYGGPDAGGNFSIDLADTNFVFDATNDKDWYHFASGMEIGIRTITGDYAHAQRYTIAGFGGATQAASQSTPTGASPSRIWCGTDDTTTTAWAAGHYITLYTNNGSLPSSHDVYSYWADANAALTGGAEAYGYG